MSMHNTVMVNDGGGGAVDPATQLSMNEVFNGAEQSTRVLYADIIDATKVSSIIDNLYAISSEGGLGGATSTLITENDSMMAATGSQKFYTGEVAQAQFSAMEEVYAKLNTTLGDIDAIYDNKATILSKIEEYNTKLLELKKDCRRNLLIAAADEWNNGKHDKDGSPERTSRRGSEPPGPKYEAGWSNDVIFEEAVKIRNYTKEEWPASNYARQPVQVTYVEYDWHKYKIIKYWAGLKCISWFKDPGFEEVEVMFADVGAKLPYDPALILPKE